jgi:predicted enzyme related to lactoylglutathione lyase
VGGALAAGDRGGRRLTAAGATVIREDVQAGTPDHMVLADPEGNEFCVL